MTDLSYPQLSNFNAYQGTVNSLLYASNLFLCKIARYIYIHTHTHAHALVYITEVIGEEVFFFSENLELFIYKQQTYFFLFYFLGLLIQEETEFKYAFYLAGWYEC